MKRPMVAASPLSPSLRGIGRTGRPIRRASLPRALLPAAAVLLAGCLRSAPTGCNVVLITIDTLRADHLSCYGYPRPTSPFIDSLAARGTLFRQASSTSPWTPPALASIFTSLHPRSHGVNRGYVDAAGGKVLGQEQLAPGLAVIAEHLARNGYDTFGISSNLHMTAATGFSRGFLRFSGLGFVRAAAVNRVFRELLPEIGGGRPYFLWVHYFDPHDPYFACRPWIANYNPAKASWSRYAGKTMPKLLGMIGEIRSDSGALQALRDLYDSEINYTDDHLRALVEALPGLDRTVLIVTSDHGEEFLERGGLGHGSSLYEEQVRVPLIIVAPGAPPAVGEVAGAVSVVDIFPTICAAAGVAPPAGLQGRSLLPLMDGSAPERDRAILAELNRAGPDRQQAALRRGDWKFVRGGGKAPGRALYDLARDPEEKRNLAREEASRAARMEGELEEWRKAHPAFAAPPSGGPPGERETKQLRSLGYLN